MSVQAFQKIITREFQTRAARHPAYSWRAFAKHVGVSPSFLIRLVQGERPLSMRIAEKFCFALQLSGDEREVVYSAVSAQRSLGERGARQVQERNLRRSVLEEERFSTMADWRTFAILNLFETVNPPQTAELIASRLGIPLQDVFIILKRLKALGMIDCSPEGFRRTAPPLTTSAEIPSLAIRLFHQRLLQKAQTQINDVPMEHRHYMAQTFTCDLDRLASLKKHIDGFLDQMEQHVGSEPQKHVFALAVQLFPLERWSKDIPHSPAKHPVEAQ